jgi:hypothetical protein
VSISLKHLDNKELVESTKRALKILSKAEADVLRHFQEIEERRLWTDAGSLYKYIAATFDLTADQIYPRLQAMRFMRAVPEVEQKIEEGILSVTNALKAQQAFNSESKRRVVSLEEKREVLETLSSASTKEADRLLAQKYPVTQKPPEKIKPVAQNQNLIQFYVDDETLKQIEELKAKYSHQMPSGKMEDLIKILIQHDNRQPKSRKRMTIKTRSRHIPAEVKRELENTRPLGCDHLIKETGQRCGSKHFLQLDHIHEYSRGGSNEVHNLRWMCGFHNRHRFKTRSGASNGGASKK